jgi:hypothetical protein
MVPDLVHRGRVGQLDSYHDVIMKPPSARRKVLHVHELP